MDKLYMVIRYADEREPQDYGVSDSYYLCGIFADRKIAEAVKEMEMAKHPEDCNGFGCIVDIKEIIPNKHYAEEDQPWLGGGFYIE